MQAMRHVVLGSDARRRCGQSVPWRPPPAARALIEARLPASLPGPGVFFIVLVGGVWFRLRLPVGAAAAPLPKTAIAFTEVLLKPYDVIHG
ncbi:hypothetical protein MTO96_029444 [Rhipicephalus appendiculatus]